MRGTRVVQLNRRTSVIRDEAGVVAKFGVLPESIPDYLAMVGDAADGYPGLPGWGAKSAAAVLAQVRPPGVDSGRLATWSVNVVNPARAGSDVRARTRARLPVSRPGDAQDRHSALRARGRASLAGTDGGVPRLRPTIRRRGRGDMSVVSGVVAAMPAPIRHDGAIDVDTFNRLVDFALAAGVDGVCVGGATGEYPHFEAAERAELIRLAAKRLPHDRALAVGIGSSSVRRTLELGRVAMRFRRSRAPASDAYVLQVRAGRIYRVLRAGEPDAGRAVSSLRSAGLHHRAVVRHHARAPPQRALHHWNQGQQRSAGNLTTLTGEPARKEWTLLVGDDRLLSAGLTAGWDGGISGVAACCPELVVALVRSSRAGEHREALRLQAQVDEVVVHLSLLPTPWGIRAALQIRGFDTGPWPLPPSAARQQQIAEFQEWILRQLPFVVKT